MIEGEEYILFLMKQKNSYFTKDKYVYLPVSLTYGKYKADDTMPKCYKKQEVSIESMETILDYSETKGQEVLLWKKEEYQSFVTLKRQVLKRFYN